MGPPCNGRPLTGPITVTETLIGIYLLILFMMASYSGVTSGGFMAQSHTTIADLFADYKYESTIGLLYLDKKKADIADVNSALEKNPC